MSAISKIPLEELYLELADYDFLNDSGWMFRNGLWPKTLKTLSSANEYTNNIPQWIGELSLLEELDFSSANVSRLPVSL